MVAPLLLLWLVVSSLPRTVTQDSVHELSAAPGTVDVADGSPVSLSDARKVLLKPPPGPDGVSEIVIRTEVTIENTSGRPIRQLCLALSYGGHLTNLAVAFNIQGNEVRRYSNASFHVRGGTVPDGPNWALTVRVSGAKFEDGTHWAAPRLSSAPLVAETLRQSESSLTITACHWKDDDYSVSLRPHSSPQIVAYRLGTVKDVPGDFEVKLGKWVELSESARESSFTDNGTSLGPDDLLAKESNSRTLPDGRVITQSFGVAIFLAEVRFTDGRIWRQNLTRDALLWESY